MDASLPSSRSPHCNPDVWPLDGISALLRFALTQSSAPPPHQQLSDETRLHVKEYCVPEHPGLEHITTLLAKQVYRVTEGSRDKLSLDCVFPARRGEKKQKTKKKNAIKVNSTSGLCCILASNLFSFFFFYI